MANVEIIGEQEVADLVLKNDGAVELILDSVAKETPEELFDKLGTEWIVEYLQSLGYKVMEQC